MGPEISQWVDKHRDPVINRQSFFLGAAVYTILGVLAAVFYLERIAVIDMAFQTFQILRSGGIQIQSGRFGAAATQIFPWLCQAVGLPLKAVLLGYSTGHILYYFALFLIVVKGLGQGRWGMMLILLATMLTTHTFYWLSEMPQGLAFLALLMAWIRYKGSLNIVRWWDYALLFGGGLISFYFHPLVLYPLLFGCAFFILEEGGARERRPLYGLATLLFLGLAFIKYKILPLDWYDAMSMERSRAFLEQWPNWLDIQSNRDLLRWCLTDYYWLPILWMLNGMFYVYRKAWPKAVLSVLAPVGFVLLINVPFYRGDNQFYLENLYLPLVFFLGLPLVFDVLPGILPARRQWIPIALIAFVGLARIAMAHETWSARIAWERRFLEETKQLPDRKILLTEDQAPMGTLIFSWSSAYEFMILSSLPHPDSARCIIIDESPWRFDSLLAKPDLFLGEFRNYRFVELPARYFHPTDTSAYVRWQGAPSGFSQ